MKSGDASGPRSESGEVADTTGRTNKARVEGTATGGSDSVSPIAQDMRSAHEFPLAGLVDEVIVDS